MKVRTLAFALLVAIAGVILARPFLGGLAFVVRAADVQGAAGRLAAIVTRTQTEQAIDIVTNAGTIPGRFYVPSGDARRVTLLVSGLHPAGIDEPRLVRLARELAASGTAVVTPDLPGLKMFEITPALTDAIEATATWMLTMPAVAKSDGRIGIIGISFSGGVSLVAAGRTSLRDKLAYVVSIGGHDDLPRVLRYLCTGAEPYPRQVGEQHTAFTRPPHDYGVAVVLLGVADKVVPRGQVERLKAIVHEFLNASALDSVDHEAAERAFARVKEEAGKLAEPSRSLARFMVDRDVVHLGARLLPYLSTYGTDPSLSVSHSPKATAPVFLLHGTADNVIPTIESEYLADDLRGTAAVTLLESDLITHTSVNNTPPLGALFQLANFWASVLSR